MSDLQKRYPFSAADGQAIPLDIIRPHGVIRKSFLLASPTAAMDVPSTVEAFSILSNEDCVVQFATSAASASALSDGVLKADSLFVPADILIVVSPPLDKKSFSIIGDSANGIAVLQFIETWSGLALQSQFARR